jgi:hypothetical protein
MSTNLSDGKNMPKKGSKLLILHNTVVKLLVPGRVKLLAHSINNIAHQWRPQWA